METALSLLLPMQEPGGLDRTPVDAGVSSTAGVISTTTDVELLAGQSRSSRNLQDHLRHDGRPPPGACQTVVVESPSERLRPGFMPSSLVSEGSGKQESAISWTPAHPQNG